MIQSFFKQADLLKQAKTVLQRYKQTHDVGYFVDYLNELNPKYDPDVLKKLLSTPDAVLLINYLADGADIR